MSHSPALDWRLRLLIWGGAAVLHIGGLIGFGLAAPESRRGGEAPVINMSLEPSPRMDSETPPNVATAAEAPAAPASAARAVPRTIEARRALPPPRPEVSIPLAEETPTPGPPAPTPPSTTTTAAKAPGAGVTASQSAPAGATQGGGGRSLGAAGAPTEDAYAARVLAWVERNKRHPGGRRGVVIVRFDLDRRGMVRQLSLAETSGLSALDKAALDQIQATQPFPKPEPGATWRTRTFTIRIDYRLTN